MASRQPGSQAATLATNTSPSLLPTHTSHNPLLMRAIWLLFTGATLAHSLARSPINHISQITDARLSTRSSRVHSDSSFDAYFSLQHNDSSQRVKLSLEPNHDLVGDDATMEYINNDGTITGTEKMHRRDYRVFKGTAWKESKTGWNMAGWSRLMVYRDGPQPLFEGAFSLDHITHHIQKSDVYMATKHALDPIPAQEDSMVVWKDSDVNPSLGKMQLGIRSVEQSCMADDLEYNYNSYDSITPGPSASWWSSPSLGKRQLDGDALGTGFGPGVNLASTIGTTAGCPSTKLVALVGVAADCTYSAAFNSSQALRANVISQYNSASALYERSFNISLGLKFLVVSNETCPSSPTGTSQWNQPCTNNIGIDGRLTYFSQWRAQRGVDGTAVWQMLTTCSTGSSVGLAWLGTLCNDGSSGSNVSGTSVVARTSTEWKVMAHEIGHNFGAVHDCNAQTCANVNITSSSGCCPLTATTCNANSQFIMNPTTMESTDNFSPCSIGNICSALGRRSVNSTCLTTNRDISLITANECGNGIVEPGEECDCGGIAGCAGNTCCNPTTCKYTPGSVCDDANDDCCNSCQFATTNTTCRASTGPCDPAEVCSGNSSTCPADKTAPNGQSCGGSGAGLTCASGQCTSRDLQCQTLINGTSTSCDSSSCQLSCINPQFGPNVCFNIQKSFLDGTPCAGNGQCQGGRCMGASTIDEINSWISQNKNLVIGIAVAVGSLLLLAVVTCFWNRTRRSPKVVQPAMSSRRVPPTYYPRQPQYYPPSPYQQQPYQQQSYPAPPQPPRHYQQQPYQQSYRLHESYPNM